MNDLRARVQQALEHAPHLDPVEIGVTIEHGIVTLWGEVNSYEQKESAEAAALSVAGVHAIANDIVVRVDGQSEHSDADIARAASEAIDRNPALPRDGIVVSVSDGWVTLKGRVASAVQHAIAEREVESLPGVRAVTNSLVF